ncbi:cell filamentation protein Fic [Rodentibacter genomosp. 2]|uniref:Fic family protein n=1 Tax=Rodentibacter genomosp. 2 TaxID=1908266 RepID=UPI0009854C91|nr:cell filamentation protein Fic [Rodentibacter genomosp. 2]
MKVSKPKSFLTLMQECFTKENWQSTTHFQAIDEKGRYLHWDKFKRIYTEKTELAWVSTKLARLPLMKKLMIGQYEFSYAVPSSLQALLHFVDKSCAGNVGAGNLAGLSKAEQNRFLLKSLIMEEAITSAQLEGAVTTRKVAKEMLESERKPRTKDEMMILNNYHLMLYAIKHKNEPLTIEKILKMHELATDKAIENNALIGAFRQDDDIYIADYEGNVIHQPPTYTELNGLIQDFCDFANKDHNGTSLDFIHPVVKAMILHFLIGFIHPFGDGNGRTARAIFYWFMLKNGYWLFEYVSISRLLKNAPAKYARAYIYTETDDLDMTYFLYYQGEIIQRAINDLDRYINDKQRQFKEFSSAITLFSSKISPKLNDRQIQILQKAVKDPGVMFTAKEISNEFGIAENTARTNLNYLRDLKLLGTFKSGNSLIYVAPHDLLERLKI